MPNIYCSKSGCGAKTEYSVIKPTICPKCKGNYASAFKIEPVIVESKKTSPLVKSRSESKYIKASSSKFNKFKASQKVEEVDVESEDDDDEEENENLQNELSEDDILQEIEELRAGISESDVLTGSDDSDGPVNFMDILRANSKKE